MNHEPRGEPPEGKWVLGALLLSLVCCGGPLLWAAGGGLIAWAGLHGIWLAMGAAAALAGLLFLVRRPRHERVLSCARECKPISMEGGRYGAA